MPLWYRTNILAQEALVLANANLENARNVRDRDRGGALKYCKEVDTVLRRIDTKAVVMDRSTLEQIIVAFREHGSVLETLNKSEKAQKSFNKAKELEHEVISSKLVHSAVAVAPLPPSIQSTVVPSRRGSPVPSSILTRQPVLPSPASNTIPGQNSELIPASIFARNHDLHAFNGKLPKLYKSLDSTPQLAYCLGLLLQDPAELNDTLNSETRTWLKAMRENTDEQERLRILAKGVFQEFTREKPKDANVVAEVVCIAPVLEKQHFRLLLGQFVDIFGSSILLNTPALEGLDQLIQSAPKDNIDVDDLVKILEHLNARLEGTHTESPEYIYRLTSVVSHILDAMVLGGVQGLNRKSLHTPLKVYLQKLLKRADPYLAFQAVYASQALLWVSNDEELWKAVLRRTGTMTLGVARIASAAKALNVVEFIDGLGNIQEGLEGAGEFFGLVGGAYKSATELMKGGQDLQGLLKEGLSFSRKQKWYPLLHATNTLLRNGELIKFKSLVCSAPLQCRRDVNFQWGVCQRLGNVAADPRWDPDIRQDAIAFLGEIYRNDAGWGQNVQIKQCILNILIQLAVESEIAKQPAESLLHDLRNDGDAIKQAHYLTCQQKGSSPQFWKAVLPLLKSSPLLDRAQKRPDIRPCLQKFRRERLEDKGQEVYIPPEAKAGRHAPDDTRFPLMENVKDFLTSNHEVLLVLGDSGAGKSTFNRQLEWELWDAYDKDKARIPIFVWLPAIKEPDQDLITNHLRSCYFEEEHIRELKDNYEVVLICDGYDECQLACNLHESNRLNKTGRWKAKMVISCRSEYLGQSYLSRFQPNDSNGRERADLLREVVILPFSKSKIRGYVGSYVEKYASMKGSSWKVENYLRAIEGIRDLQELVSNPFLLKLSLEVLPEMVGQKDLSSVKITRVALYDKYIENWVKERGEKRLVKNSNLNEGKKKALRVLLDDNFIQNAVDFMTKLAVAIFEHQDGQAIVEYSRKKPSWKDEFFRQDDDETEILRDASPIIRISNGNRYKFIHLSFQEYGLARAVFEPRRGEEKAEVKTTGSAGTSQGLKFMNQGTERGAPVDINLVPDSNSPLFRTSYVNKPSILQFLAERVAQEPIFEKQLCSFIEQSKTNKIWNIAAANAITILVRARMLFNGANLKGVQIPGADLSGGQFDSAQLQGADLRNTTLRNIWLHQADFSNARMEGIEFGERPYLAEVSSVNCCAYSPDGRDCIFSLEDGSISVYDTSTWTKTSTIRGHNGPVYCAVFSPSGQQIASCSDDKTVRLWDAQTGARGPIFKGHTDWVQSVVYSPKGHQIASGSNDKTVRLWDAQTGAPGPILSGHTDWVLSVAYSPTGHQIASGSRDKTVRLWDAQTNAPGPVLSGHTNAVSSVVYSPSGHQIASSSEDTTVRLWDAQTGAPGPILSDHTDWVLSVVYSPSGHQIASGSGDKTVRLWDAQTGVPGPILSGHTNWVQSVVYSPSGHQIASGSYDNTVRLWDTQTSAADLILSGHTDQVWTVVCSPGGYQVASGGKDKTVRLWDAQTGTPGPVLGGHTHYVWSVVYSPSGHQIASCSYDNTVRLWDSQTGSPGPILRGHTDGIQSIMYSPSGHQIASCSHDNTVRLWDAQTGAPGPILSGHTGFIPSVSYSPSGHQIASCSHDNTVRLWDSQTGSPGPVLCGHTDRIHKVVYSPSGHQIASAGYDMTVRLWDAQTGESGPTLSGHTGEVHSIVYSPIGRQIASGSGDRTVRLWDTQTGAAGPILSGHTWVIMSVAYSPSGHQIASGSLDNTARLWDVNSGQCLAVLNDFHGPVSSIAWIATPNSTYFVTGSHDRSVRMWKVVEGGQFLVRLRWTTIHNRLIVSDICLQGVQGLSRVNMQLLKQRGAIRNSIPPLNFLKESDKMPSMMSVTSGPRIPTATFPVSKSTDSIES